MDTSLQPKIRELIVESDITILDAIKYMDMIRRKLLIMTNEGVFLGLLSIGDIQRAIIKNIPLSAPARDIMRDDYIVAQANKPIEDIKKTMRLIRAEFMPVISESGEISHAYFWEDLFGEKEILSPQCFDLPVVIMAGGFGMRLRPLTNVLPKALIPVGEKSIMEEIMASFAKYGCKHFYLSVNYKADLIKYYLNSQNLPYCLQFIEEKQPLGTAGSLSLLKNEIKETLFVINCDILVEQDYSEILEYHRSNKNDITVVAALKHLYIPYGTLESGENGLLKCLSEKPELTFKINTGMYIIEPHILSEIPTNTYFHITQLIERMSSKTGKVGVFPISEKSWREIGEWEEYLKSIRRDQVIHP